MMRETFQMTYQPSRYFHTGLVSQHEESNKVRRLLLCLKAVADIFGVCFFYKCFSALVTLNTVYEQLVRNL